MALQEKVYWESLPWNPTPPLPLQCNMQEPSLGKQKANSSSMEKAMRKAGPHRCFYPTIDKENVAAASHNLAFSSLPFCACKSSAQIRGKVFDSSTGCMRVDSIVGGEQRSVDDAISLTRMQASVDSLEGIRQSVDSGIAAQFPEELLAKTEARWDRRAREAGILQKLSKEKLGLDGKCRNVQKVKEANVHALEDDGCKSGPLVKSVNVCAEERILVGSNVAECEDKASWEGVANVNVREQRRHRSMSELVCKASYEQGVKGSDVAAHERICRGIGSGLYVKIRSSDMPMSMQLYVIRLTKQVLEKRQEYLSLMDTARALKKGLDRQYGAAWHCVVGSSYGSYITHSVGSAIYFHVGKLAILLFKANLPQLTLSP